MEKLELVFEQEKETKNTVRYQEVADDEPVVGTLYVQKWAAKKLGNTTKIKLTIEAEE